MRVLIGDLNTGYLLGDKDSKIQMTAIHGLETPPIRNSSGDWSGKDGGYMSYQLYSAREITIEGFYLDEEFMCTPGTYSERMKFFNFLIIRKLFPIYFEFDNGLIFYTEGYLTDVKSDLENSNYGEYMITFYCPDNQLKRCERLGDKNSIWYQYVIYNNPFELGAGHLVPEYLPVLFKEGKSSSIINYIGGDESWPVFTINGPLTAPITLSNVVQEKYICLLRDVAEGEVLKIDMKNKLVTVNGVSATIDIEETSEWWNLQNGTNNILLTSGSITDRASGNIQWTINYQGV